MNAGNRERLLQQATIDLLSIPPLIFRGVRKKLIGRTASDFDVNISPHSFEIMRLLECEGTMHIAEIGERLQIARAQMTKLIDKLVWLKIVKRSVCREDRRQLNISLTPMGKKLLRERINNINEATRSILSALTDEELENISSLLRKLNDILSGL